MTTAPPTLLAARRLLIDHLGPNVPARPGVTIIDPLGDPVWEVGIVPDADHVGGYHCGSDRVRRVDGIIRDYSVNESSRDRLGLTLHAAALDIGRFAVRTRLGTFDLRHFSRWLVAQCVAGTRDTRDSREVIYSPDGKVVRRWDRLGRRTSGDSSHLSHTHISYHRDAIKAGRDQTVLIRRYLTKIGLLEDDMPTADEIARAVWAYPLPSDALGITTWRAGDWLKQARVAAIRAAGDDVDEQAIVAGVLLGLDAATIAAAIPQDIARQVADMLAARLAQ